MQEIPFQFQILRLDEQHIFLTFPSQEAQRVSYPLHPLGTLYDPPRQVSMQSVVASPLATAILDYVGVKQALR